MRATNSAWLPFGRSDKVFCDCSPFCSYAGIELNNPCEKIVIERGTLFHRKP
jgi:hypothetical protein